MTAVTQGLLGNDSLLKNEPVTFYDGYSENVSLRDILNAKWDSCKFRKVASRSMMECSGRCRPSDGYTANSHRSYRVRGLVRSFGFVVDKTVLEVFTECLGLHCLSSLPESSPSIIHDRCTLRISAVSPKLSVPAAVHFVLPCWHEGQHAAALGVRTVNVSTTGEGSP